MCTNKHTHTSLQYI
jgi:hypothetical protein